jgi:RNA polymerase sigma-70 factor (ECF subfamily)
MTRDFDERARWLARAVLPHEPALRAWLGHRRVVDLDIDDIVQETYATLVSLESIDAIRDARSYTFQVAFSILAMHVRHARVVPMHSTADIEQLAIEAPEPSPERQVEDRDELRHLAEALASLPDKCRQVFLLRRVEGLSQREAAARLGLSEKTLEKHMARGIRHLMDVFGRGGKPAFQASKERKSYSELPYDRTIDEPGD